MNKWMILRIIVLGGGFLWAVWSLRETPSVDLLAPSPVILKVTPGISGKGDGGDALSALMAAGADAETCRAKGVLKVTVGKGLERAEWLGTGEKECLEKALERGWPEVAGSVELEWTVGR